MTMMQYLQAIRRRAWLLAALPLFAVVVAVAVTRTLPPVYESDVTLVVRPAQPINSLDPNTSPSSPDQVSRTYAQLMTQRPLLVRVIADLKLHATPEQLQSAIKVAPQANTTVLKVTVQNSNPAQARDIANKLVDDFITQTKQIQQGQVDQYTAKTEVQLEQLRKQINAEQDRMDQLIQKANSQSGRSGRSTQASPSTGDLSSLSVQEQSEYNSLQQQITVNRSQYFDIVRNESDIELNVARTADSVVVVAPAVAPNSPSSPKLWLNVLFAAVTGIGIAVAVIFLMEHLDQSIRSGDQMMERTGLLPLASVPSWSVAKRSEKELAALQKDSALSEPYRTLRTNILFSNIDRRLRTIAVTSALPKEGKSRTAANLSIALAAAGHRTLLIDCDFRRPVQHKLFGRIRNVGLADVMLGDSIEAEAIGRVDQVPNLWLLSSGPTPPNPSELLGSARMRELLARLADNFSHVVIDTPPVNVVADALVLGSYTDATLVVVDYGRSRYPTVRSARESLQRVGARVLGGVLNKVPTREGYGYYYYNYSENGKPSRHQRDAKPMKETKELAAVAVSEEPAE